MKYHPPNWLLIAALTPNLLAQAQTVSPSSAPPDQPAAVIASRVCAGNQNYDEITNEEHRSHEPRIIEFGKSPIELTIIASEFNDNPVDAKSPSAPAICFDRVLSIGTNVSTTGEVASFMDGEGAFRNGGGETLTPENFARLQSLMANLPDDHRRVPPATRRISVEIVRDGTATDHLYDSADLPDEILEMLRITGARINVVTPLFKPDRIVSLEEAESLNLPKPHDDSDRSFSPDGAIGVMHNQGNRTLIVYDASKRPHSGSIPEDNQIIHVIPEPWQPRPPGGYWSNSEFSPDGRYLLVTWGIHVGAMIFDSTTWQPVTSPHLFPQNLKEYLHTPDWNLGIAVTGSGEVYVWDQRAHRVVSKLPGLGELEPPPVITDEQGHRVYTEARGEIQGVDFSPDRTRVAIYSGPNNVFKLRLSVFEIQSGRKVRDLWPVAWMSYPSGQPVWWNDGRWLLANYAGQSTWGGTGVWNAETGRFIGTLDSPGCEVGGVPVAVGTNVFKVCHMSNGQQDKVFEWSLDGIRKELESAASLASNGQDSLQ